jgi:hypothetical protein
MASRIQQIWLWRERVLGVPGQAPHSAFFAYGHLSTEAAAVELRAQARRLGQPRFPDTRAIIAVPRQ